MQRLPTPYTVSTRLNVRALLTVHAIHANVTQVVECRFETSNVTGAAPVVGTTFYAVSFEVLVPLQLSYGWSRGAIPHSAPHFDI